MAEEKNFELKVRDYIESKGGWQVKYFANSYTKRGIPDVFSCLTGYFVAIEFKASNGKPSDLQLYHQKEIRKSGGICIILYPDQFEKFKVLFDLLSNDKKLEAYDYQFTFDKKVRKCR